MALTYADVDRDVLATLGWPGKAYLALVVACFALLGGFLWAWSRVIWVGVGVTHLNNPVGWGLMITNFVFWVGIGHAGTLISAILYLFRVTWRTPIFRASETMTVFAVLTAAMFPLMHLGRVWVFYYILPYFNGRQLWPNFRSPLVWDVLAVSTYLTVSVIFLFVGMVPDLATVRDRSRHRFARWFYKIFSLGWTGSPRQWRHHAAAYLFFAALCTPLVVSVHSVVSWDFAMSILPGWHDTIFAPYFVAGAILSGLAMVLTILIPLRRVFRVQHIVRIEHLENMAKLLLVTSLVVGYAYVAEWFISWYSGDQYEGGLMRWRQTGHYAWIYWLLIVCNVLAPLSFFWKRVRTSVIGLLIVSVMVNVGMWFERLLIIVSSLAHDFMPYQWGLYWPDALEWLILAGSFGMFLGLFLVFVRIFPSVSIAELKEELPPPETHAEAAS